MENININTNETKIDEKAANMQAEAEIEQTDETGDVK